MHWLLDFAITCVVCAVGWLAYVSKSGSVRTAKIASVRRCRSNLNWNSDPRRISAPSPCDRKRRKPAARSLISTLSVEELNKLDETINKAAKNILDARQKEGQWEYGSCLGVPSTCQYFLFARVFLGKEFRLQATKLDTRRLRNVILENQLMDGSWQPVPDVNSGGDLTATMFCYWTLKVLGDDIHSEKMMNARNFILSGGGLGSVQTMAKIFLALTGNVSWGSVLPYVPLFIFSDKGLGWLWNLRTWVPAWIPPHMVSIAYLRHQKVCKRLPELDLSELRVESKPVRALQSSFPKTLGAAPESVRCCIQNAKQLTQGRGSIGSFTLSSLLGVLMYEDYLRRYKGEECEELPKRIHACLEFCEGTYFDPPNAKVAYLGMSMYGDFWDTCLCGIALLKANIPPEELFQSAEYLVPHVSKDGGLGFSSEFDYYPDCDCTAEMVIFFRALTQGVIKGSKGERLKKLADRGVCFLRERQNRNGGWAAFDKDLENTFVMHAVKAASTLADSAELDDPACVDITCHVLEVFAHSGITKDDPQVVRAIHFLKKSQENCGTFQCRWGTNGIYGASSVLVGLSAIGFDLDCDWVQRAANWLVSVQNNDGGWGESTVLSFRDPQGSLGKGASTPTQTAWAVLGLLEMGHERYWRAADEGIRYLMRTFEEEERFMDKSSVAPGHRNIVPMVYESYAPAFSLQAIASYKGKL